MKMTRDGDVFIARLTPRQVSAMYEALSYLSQQDYGDTQLTLLVGAGRETVDALVERLAVRHTESSDFRLTMEELHMVHSALTAVPLNFTGREGAFLEEPFNIRLGFYRENFDALAYAVVRTAAEA
ncbi:hypothetical protein CP966_25155 [Streptomyces galilaeus]|uniref:Uncharacterized protein n=1 Tax=Streptomyces bobili TaxID=67280 RepID=A0ABZ1QWP8_9ACTN|nr:MULTISPECIES: hypothetical protein [Streptomyces]QEU68168.1 hypothetical protein CP966_25155 [Streptomyces galilaeus]GGW47510.1 hypothetical protein GCM10010350_34560 [Streptomyces galilaeus]